MNWTDRHAAALRAVMSALDAVGVRWMVLRNYEGLPELNRAKDVDLLVCREDFPRAQALMDEALTSRGFLRQSRLRLQYVWCSTYWRCEAAHIDALKIDLLDGFVWKGAQILSFAQLFAERRRHDRFFVPSVVHDGFMLWVKPLMTGGIVKDKYRADVAQAALAFPAEFKALVDHTFGVSTGAVVWPILASGDLDATVALRSRICGSAWVQALRRRPVATLRAAMAHYLTEVARRARRPAGSFVAVVAPDGAGKSTFIEELRRELCRVMVRESDEVEIRHFRPRILPNIKALVLGRRHDPSKEDFSSPHRAQPSGAIVSMARLTYYWFDYVLGYWCTVRRACVSGRFCVFDRYFHDFVVDPRRSRIRLPDGLRRAFLALVPAPDMVFFLDADVDTIRRRKQELPAPEIDRQLREYRRLAASQANFVTLDARGSPTALAGQALQALIQRIHLPARDTKTQP